MIHLFSFLYLYLSLQEYKKLATGVKQQNKKVLQIKHWKNRENWRFDFIYPQEFHAAAS